MCACMYILCKLLKFIYNKIIKCINTHGGIACSLGELSLNKDIHNNEIFYQKTLLSIKIQTINSTINSMQHLEFHGIKLCKKLLKSV